MISFIQMNECCPCLRSRLLNACLCEMVTKLILKLNSQYGFRIQTNEFAVKNKF